MALESDSGGEMPHGISIDAPDSVIAKIKSYSRFFDQLGMHEISRGGSGVDIGFLKESGIPLMGLRTVSQRYFDYHHSANDVFESVHPREMQYGSATMALLIYFADKYGL